MTNVRMATYSIDKLTVVRRFLEDARAKEVAWLTNRWLSPFRGHYDLNFH